MGSLHPNTTADLVGVWRLFLTVSSHTAGRHRAPGPSGSAPSISRSARPATKGSALIIISGAMAASLALPASAAAPVARVRATAAVAHAAPVAGVVPSAAQAPLVPRPFGHIAFTGVLKPKPVVVERKVATVSRSITRSPISTPARTPKAARKAASRAAPAANAAGILRVAASLAGIYYIYGGTTPAGFDCSGYTQYVFAQVGIKLPRTAEQQRDRKSVV